MPHPANDPNFLGYVYLYRKGSTLDYVALWVVENDGQRPLSYRDEKNDQIFLKP